MRAWLGIAAVGIVAALSPVAVPEAAAQNVATCESVRGDRRVFCPMRTAGGVYVRRQLSQSRCVEGRTFFVVRGGVQVRRGCRATFVNARFYERNRRG